MVFGGDTARVQVAAVLTDTKSPGATPVRFGLGRRTMTISLNAALDRRSTKRKQTGHKPEPQAHENSGQEAGSTTSPSQAGPDVLA